VSTLPTRSGAPPDDRGAIRAPRRDADETGLSIPDWEDSAVRDTIAERSREPLTRGCRRISVRRVRTAAQAALSGMRNGSRHDGQPCPEQANLPSLELTSMRLLVATRNQGKRQEFQQLLAPLGATIDFPDDLDIHIDVREDGTTYADNARKKAEGYARASGLLTLADDSGLEVDALGGAPGIHSARYASGHDAGRVTKLLSHLRDVSWEARTARFRCVVFMVTPGGDVHQAEGTCEGMIAFEPMGEGGFGYDPIFYLPDRACTMAQLSPEEKNRISHRARAVQAAFPALKQLLERESVSSTHLTLPTIYSV